MTAHAPSELEAEAAAELEPERRRRRNLLRTLTLGLGLAGGALVLVLYLGSVRDRKLCAAANESRATLRAVLVLARDSNPPRTTAGRLFFSRALARVEAIPCR